MHIKRDIYDTCENCFREISKIENPRKFGAIYTVITRNFSRAKFFEVGVRSSAIRYIILDFF